MRVWGVDPGLTRWGLGVVEGGLGQPLGMPVAVGVDPRPGRRTRRRSGCWRCTARGSRPVAGTALARRRRGRAGLRQGTTSVVMGTAQASASRCWPPPGWGSRSHAHPQRGQGRGLRQRPRRQGAGDRDGDPACWGSPARNRPTPPTRSRWRSAICGGGADDKLTANARRPAAKGVACADDRVRRAARCSSVGLDHAVVEVGGVGLRSARTPGTAAGLRRGAPGAAGHRDGRPRGLDDAVRLRRRRGARPVQHVQGVSGVGPRSRWPRWRCTRRRCGRRWRWRRHRTDPGARHRQARRRTHGAGTAGQDRPAQRRGGRRGGAQPRRPAARGAARSREALVGLGWSVKQADDAVERGGPRVPATAVTSPGCCGPRSGRLGR